jgi:hypothetical protein
MPQKFFRERGRAQGPIRLCKRAWSAPLACKTRAVSPLIAGSERRPILRGCPPAARNVGLSPALGCKSPQIQPVPKCGFGDLRNGLVQNGQVIVVIGAQHGCRSHAERDHRCKQEESLHYFFSRSFSELNQIDEIFSAVWDEIKASDKLGCHRVIVGGSNRRHLLVRDLQLLMRDWREMRLPNILFTDKVYRCEQFCL